VKLFTVRTVLTIAVFCEWPIQQLDMKNVFLHGTLSETVFSSQPTHFTDPAQSDLICRLNKSLYGLKQAPRSWYNCFITYLTSLGLIEAKWDTLFILRRGSDMIYPLLYIDDIILTTFNTNLLRRTISALQRKFPMKDLEPLHHFLSITVERRPNRLFLH
jgi:hypothetical protein